ncbi:hypothetical protein EJB05_10625, partial [Eragrostis curvula]
MVDVERLRWRGELGAEALPLRFLAHGLRIAVLSLGVTHVVEEEGWKVELVRGMPRRLDGGGEKVAQHSAQLRPRSIEALGRVYSNPNLPITKVLEDSEAGVPLIYINILLFCNLYTSSTLAEEGIMTAESHMKNIKPFNGIDFPLWKEKVQDILKSLELDYVLHKDKPLPSSSDIEKYDEKMHEYQFK